MGEGSASTKAATAAGPQAQCSSIGANCRVGGTGKTETMSERFLFLLATAQAAQSQGASELRADDVAFITFTRESAREMRARLARTLLMRQRLSRRCVLPALAWMMQLSSADVTTPTRRQTFDDCNLRGFC